MRTVFAFIVSAVAIAVDILVVVVPTAIIVLLLSMVARCEAQVYQIRVGNGSASAVCVGTNPAVFVTAKHVFRNATNGQVTDGQRWAQIRNVRIDATDDLASFEAPGTYTATGLVENVPDGVDVTACGWTPDRERFCFTASVSGDWLYARNGDHSLPGDSGGGAFVETARGRCLVGMPIGYSCNRRVNNRCESLIVPSSKICRFLRTQYGTCPTCPQYQRPQPLPRPTPVLPPSNRGDVLPGGCSVVVDYDRVAREVFERYGDRLRGKDGKNGRDGTDGQPGETVDLDLDALADVITQNYAERIRGPQGKDGRDGVGTPGPQGPRGLIGVPTETELAAVVDLWVERNETRILEYVREVIRDGETVDVSGITARIKRLEEREQRVMIVDGSTKQVIDDETYKPGEPIVLDIRRLLESAGN